MFCKQCIFQNLLEQKKLNKKKMKQWQEANKLESDQLALEAHLATQAKLEAFVKREESITHASSSKPRDGEKEEASQSWWLPSEAPAASSSTKHRPSQDTHCPRDGHALKVKDLVAVDFKCETKKHSRVTDDQDIDKTKENTDYICHVCSKDLKAISKVILIKTCGHAICYKCAEEFAKKKCPTCDVKCDENGEKILLQPPASSFSAGGSTVASKATPAPRMM